jgi:hypothetical protein
VAAFHQLRARGRLDHHGPQRVLVHRDAALERQGARLFEQRLERPVEILGLSAPVHREGLTRHRTEFVGELDQPLHRNHRDRELALHPGHDHQAEDRDEREREQEHPIHAAVIGRTGALLHERPGPADTVL